MFPEHRDRGGSCSVPPDEIFTFSAVKSTVVRPSLCVATGIKLRRRREMWFYRATGSNGIKQRFMRMKIRRLVLFSLCEQGPSVDDGTNALIFETIPCVVCEGQSPCERMSPCETEWFRIIARRSPHLVRVQNLRRACRCPLCVVGLATFQYHLQFSGVSSTLVPCSHPWGEDVKERLTKCSHWPGADKDLFQSHATAALEGEMRMDWSCSAQEYRCCLGLVIQKVVEDGVGCRASQFWLLMWAAFALISLYNLRLRDFEKYFEVSNVVSDVLECHLRTSLSYFTKGRNTCKKRRLEIKGVLRKTLGDLQADCNRVHFEHGLTKKATKSGISEVELCGQLCEQHARAGNYEDFFHWKKKLKELAGDNWMEFIEGGTLFQLLMDIGDDFRLERCLSRDKPVSYFYPELVGMTSGELDSRLKDAEALYQQGEVRKAFECVMELKQKLEVFRSYTTDRSVFIALLSCQTKLLAWVACESHKLSVQDHGGSDSWLEEFYKEQRSLLEAGFVDHSKEQFIIFWALGYRSNCVTFYHFVVAGLYDRKTIDIFKAIQQLHVDWCAHEWNAHTIPSTRRILRDMHSKLGPKSNFFMKSAGISRIFQCLIHYQQQVKDMMLKCCTRIYLEPNQVSLRQVLEYGNAASNVAGTSSSREAFLWGERNLQSSLLYQLPRNRLCADSHKELQKFFHDDVFAWDVLKEAHELCGPGAVVIAYQFLSKDTMLAAYVLRHNEEVVMRVHDKDLESDETRCLAIQVKDAVKAIYAELDRPKGDNAHIKPLSFLHSILYDPVSDLLEDCAMDEKLIIIPGRDLTNVPFPLLYNPRLQQHLFERHVVSLSHSLQVIKHLDNMHNNLQCYSLLNNRMMGTTITDTSLQGGPAEAAILDDLFGKKHVTRLVKAEVIVTDVVHQATLPSRKGCCQAFLHFTTHGEVNSKYYPSGVLHVAKCVSTDQDSSDVEDCGDDAGGHDEDSGGVKINKADLSLGVLRSEQIVRNGIDLRTFVAVLAACQSGRGKEYPGQGLLNLPRAFMIAGVPSVVGTQYLVSDDESTPFLLSVFYKHLIQGEDVATALCKAMRFMKGRAYKLNQLGAFIVWGLPTCKLPEHIRKLVHLSAYTKKIWIQNRNDIKKSNVWVTKSKVWITKYTRRSSFLRGPLHRSKEAHRRSSGLHLRRQRRVRSVAYRENPREPLT